MKRGRKASFCRGEHNVFDRIRLHKFWTGFSANMWELALLILIAVWPIVGLAILGVVGGRPAAGEGALPPAHGVTEVLARMYLWPIVLWRIRIARTRRGPGENNS